MFILQSVELCCLLGLQLVTHISEEGCGNFIPWRCKQHKNVPEKINLVIYQNTRCHSPEIHSNVVYYSTYTNPLRVYTLSKTASVHIIISDPFMIIRFNIIFYFVCRERWRRWLRRSASWRRFLVQFPVGSLEIFNWLLPSVHSQALRYVHPLAEANNKKFPWGQIFQSSSPICPEFQSTYKNSTKYTLSESYWVVLRKLHIS
jgi:hypothetical protein